MLYTVNGKSFSPQCLRSLQGSFAESYYNSIKAHADRSFLKIYKADQSFRDCTFQEFSVDVEQVRRALLTSYSEQEVLIIVDSNTYESLVYMTAAVLGGFTIAPMSPFDGSERILSKQKQINQKSVIFAGTKFLSQMPQAVPMTISQDSFGPKDSKPRAADCPPILIFTSGTTGYSKIVQQTEVGILANVDALIELHGFHERHVIATPLPLFHVNALEFSFFCSLFSGQRLVIFDGFDFFTVLRSLKEDKVQILSVVPHILKSLLDLSTKVLAQASDLKYCVTAASSLSPELAERLAKTFPFKIIQGYGLSEAINFSLKNNPRATKEYIDRWLTMYKRPSVGTPLRGNEVAILSEVGEVLGEGQEGELCLRGHGVMLGYKNHDNSTVFAQDYLHTGDLGFYQVCPETQAKHFFITGRKKDVIKRFGFTVSLVEIDDLLSQWLPPGNITAIAVPFLSDSAGEEIGVAVSAAATRLELLSLKDFLESRIPSFMRPRVIVQTDAKLRTDSGKAQRWTQSSLFKEFQGKNFGEKVFLKET